MGHTTSIAACTARADSSGTDRAARTRGDESLRSTSGCAMRRRAPNARRRPTSPRPHRGSLEFGTPMCRIAAACASASTRRSGKSGVARVPRRVPPSAFQWRRVSSDASCRLTHVASRQPLLAATAEEYRREDRFPARRAGGTIRHVEYAESCPQQYGTCQVKALEHLRARPLRRLAEEPSSYTGVEFI